MLKKTIQIAVLGLLVALTTSARPQLLGPSRSGDVLARPPAAERADIPSADDKLTIRQKIAAFAQEKKLLAADVSGNHQFGSSVSISGDTAVVGANFANAVYVFERDLGGPGNWGEAKKLTAEDSVGGDMFGQAIAISGDTVVVGVLGDDDGAANSGSAYVFERNRGGTGNWGQAKKLTAADAAGFDQFGISVSISGNTVVIGANSDDDAGSESGSAYVFERDLGGPDNWGQASKLTAADAAAGDRFGESVSISGNTLVIGAHFDDDGGGNSGSAYVYERNLGGDENWGEAKKLTAGDAAADDRFGYSVSIGGDTLVIGAVYNDDGGSDSGSAYVFERNLGGSENWGEAKKLTASDAVAYDFFGHSLSIHGDMLAVGVRSDDDAGSESGSTYVFERNSGGAGNWGQTQKINAADAAAGDEFGMSVSIDGNTLVVGSRVADAQGVNSGSAYVFALPSNTIDLAVSTTESIDPAVAGSAAGNLTYTVEVTNSGSAGATGVVLSHDLTLPSAVSVDSRSPSGATTFTATGGSGGEWTVGNLAAGASETLTVVLTVDAPAAPGTDVISSTATVTEVNESDSMSGNDSATATTSIASNTVDLAISMTESSDPVDPGSSLTHTVTVSNNGSANATGVVVSHALTLPSAVSVDSRSPSGATTFTLTSDPDGDWTIGELAAGASETLTVVLIVDALATPGTNVVSGTAAVSAVNESDSTTGNDSATATTSIGSKKFPLEKKLNSPNAGGNAFGNWVAISGDTAAIGVSHDTVSQGGSAYIFERNHGGVGSWGPVKRLDAYGVDPGDRFGSPTAISGDTVVLGSRADDSFTGSAYIFERNQGGLDNWGEVKKLTAADAATGDDFGFSVAINGDTIIVGAILNDDAGSASGAAYIFERNQGGGNNWGEVKKLTAADAAGDDNFGISVAISGDTVLVGAHGDDSLTGAAYVFERHSGGTDNWGQVRKLTADDAADGDQFGERVAISGDTIVVGAILNDDAGADSGSAYVFERNSGGTNNWGQVRKLTADDAAADDRFGNSVAISGDRILVGSERDDHDGSDAGSVYVFERHSGGPDNWGQETKLIASDAFSDDFFGNSVAIDGTRMLVGSRLDDDLGIDSGSVYIYVEPNTVDLAVSTAESTDTVIAGSGARNLTHTVTVTNHGPEHASGVELAHELTLPAGVSIDSVTPVGSTSFDYTTAPDGVWTVGSLLAGSSETLQMVLTVGASARAGSNVIGHTATVTAFNVSDTDSGNDAATLTTSIRQEADLWVTNDDGIPAAVPGEPTTYTIIAANDGPSDDPAVTLDDDFPADLECIYKSVASGGATGHTSSATPGAIHLQEELSLPVGSSVTYAVNCTIAAAATGKLTNTATITTSVIDPFSDNNVAIDTTHITPINDSVKTLILWHPQRMEDLGMGSAAELDELRDALGELAKHPQVSGRVVDLGGLINVAPLYAAWDAATAAADEQDAANAILFDPQAGLQKHLQNLVRVFIGAEYVVIVGGDDVIPFARLPDDTALLPEERYVEQRTDGGYDHLSADGTTVGRAAAANYYLSDDPLVALIDPVRGPVDLVQRGLFFLPDLAVGRLVETPGEIVDAIDNFQSRGGVVDLAERTHKVQVAGYDFLIDSANVVKAGWQSSLTLSAPELDATMIGQDFDRDELLAGLCGGGESYGLINLNGHATHYQEGVPGTSYSDIQGLESDALDSSTACNGLPLDLDGAVIYAVGCHGGLPVPDSAGAGDHPLDLPQTFLRRGALVYIANTGYGWGLKKGTGYGERLIEIFSEQLRSRSVATVGHEVRAAKLRYYLESGRLDAYDLKTLMQWTYYGLPMVRIRTGIGDAMGQSTQQPFAGPAPSAAKLPAFEKLGAVQVSRQVSGHGAPIKADLPDFLTRLEQRFEFSDASYTKRSSTGEPLSVWGCPDVDGCYYTLNGVANRGTGDSDQPIEPFAVFDSRLSGTSQHGVLWLGGDYEEEDDWRPIFAELISSGAVTGSNHGSTPVKKSVDPIDTPFPPRFTDALCRPSELEVNSLVVPTGEIRQGPGASGPSGPVDPADYTIHRLYESIDVEVFYYNNLSEPAANCDREGPRGLEPGDGPFSGGRYHSTDGARVEWRVPVYDDAGVWRVVVVYDLGESPFGSWVPFELTPEGVDADGYTVFSGDLGFSSGQSLTYTIQAVDNRGNVSFLPFQGTESTSSGVEPVYRDTVEVPIGGQADLEVTLTPGLDPVAGEVLMYLVNVRNLDGGLATDLVVEHLITEGEATFWAAGPPPWSCTSTSEWVRCSLDELDEGENSELAFFYLTSSAGTLEATVSVTSAESDPDLGNNSAHAETEVLPCNEHDRLATALKGVSMAPLSALAEWTAGIELIVFAVHSSHDQARSSRGRRTEPWPTDRTAGSRTVVECRCSRRGRPGATDRGAERLARRSLRARRGFPRGSPRHARRRRRSGAG